MRFTKVLAALRTWANRLWLATRPPTSSDRAAASAPMSEPSTATRDDVDAATGALPAMDFPATKVDSPTIPMRITSTMMSHAWSKREQNPASTRPIPLAWNTNRLSPIPISAICFRPVRRKSNPAIRPPFLRHPTKTNSALHQRPAGVRQSSTRSTLPRPTPVPGIRGRSLESNAESQVGEDSGGKPGIGTAAVSDVTPGTYLPDSSDICHLGGDVVSGRSASRSRRC